MLSESRFGHTMLTTKKVKVKASQSHTRYRAYVGPGADPGVQTVGVQTLRTTLLFPGFRR